MKAWQNEKGKYLLLNVFNISTTSDINKASIINYLPEKAKNMRFHPVEVYKPAFLKHELQIIIDALSDYSTEEENAIAQKLRSIYNASIINRL